MKQDRLFTLGVIVLLATAGVTQAGVQAKIDGTVTDSAGNPIAGVVITLTSPDGHLDLTTGTVDIRSTAVSGLGLVITIIAFVILGMWWARTILRVRRQHRAASVATSEDDSGG